MNDARMWERDAKARKVADFLSRAPEGPVTIAGPADATTWNLGKCWDDRALHYMSPVKTCGHPAINCRAPLRTLTQRHGMTKTGEVWRDFHFMDTPDNGQKMTTLLSCLAYFTQLTANITELAQFTGKS